MALGMPRTTKAQRQPSAPPAIRRDHTHEYRTQVAEHLRPDVHHRRHAGANPDRVVVGNQRRVDRDVVGLGNPREAHHPEKDERRRRDRGQEREHRRRQRGEADDRNALPTIGEPPERNRAERVERGSTRW